MACMHAIPLPAICGLHMLGEDVAWPKWKGGKCTKGNSYRQQTTPTVYAFGHERLIGSVSAALRPLSFIHCCVAAVIQAYTLQADNKVNSRILASHMSPPDYLTTVILKRL